MGSPLQPHSATPAELRDRLEAERRGRPFLVLRDREGLQVLVDLAAERATIGRALTNDVALPWDTEVSRLHAELECLAGEWTVSDDGLSTNGTFVNGRRTSGRVRLRDGDVVRAGQTSIAFRRPSDEDSRPTRIASGPSLSLADLTPTQRQVLIALARPYRDGELAAPAPNTAIAEELHLSVDAVKANLRALFGRFGLAGLPQNQKRSRLVAEALKQGVVTHRDLDA